MNRERTLAQLRGQLAVSCQAYEDNPLYGTDNMVTLARCVLAGGARALRLCWPDAISRVRELTDVPIIGINKVMIHDGEGGFDALNDVYITPTLSSAIQIAETGCDVIALDGTGRPRPGGERLEDIVAALRESYPELVLMADVATIEDGARCAELGFDIVSSTLSGYTEQTCDKDPDEPDFELIAALKRETDCLVNGEGRIWNVEHLRRAWECGADMVTIGSAITNPMKTTSYFLAHMTTDCADGKTRA